MIVAALYVDAERGPYSAIPDVDVWGEERDARLYAGPWPVVAHPPCGPWGRLAHLCTSQDPELALRAVEQVRRWGGVLEHPAGSRLWTAADLPLPGEPERDGLRTIEVRQCDWGHEAAKRTWLLLSRVALLPPFPSAQKPTRYIDTPDRYKRQGDLFRRGPQHVPKSRRHLTPPAFAAWLVEAARSAREQDREQDRQDGAPASADPDDEPASLSAPGLP